MGHSRNTPGTAAVTMAVLHLAAAIIHSTFVCMNTFHTTGAHDAFSSFVLGEIFLGLAFQEEWDTRPYSPSPCDRDTVAHSLSLCGSLGPPGVFERVL